MSRLQNPNLQILEVTLEKLDELAEEFVFVGGCATGLLITDVASPPIRATIDVDVIVEVSSLAEYYQIASKLRQKGFKEDVRSEAPICRWVSDGLVLDVVPTDENILGFGNIWYRNAMMNSMEINISLGKKIKLISAPFFLITKLEAFADRGKGDYLMSHDIEDLIAVLDGRKEIFEEIIRTMQPLKSELKKRFASLLKDSAFIDAVYGHMPGDGANQQRVPHLISLMKKIASLTIEQL